MIAKKNSICVKCCENYFSLVELLVVIAIIGMLVAIGGGGYAVVQRKMAESNTQATLYKLKVALEAYKQKHGYYIQQISSQEDESFFPLDSDSGGNSDNFNRCINVSELRQSGALVEDNNRYWVVDGYKPQKTNDKLARRIRYLCPGDDGAAFELRSCGKDEQFDTDDDIVVKQ